MEQIRRDRSRPRAATAQTVHPDHAAQVLQQGHIPETVGEVGAKRHRFVLRQTIGARSPCLQRLAVGPFLHARGVTNANGDLRIDLFPQPRHGHKSLRADLLKVVENRLGAFGEIDRRGRSDRVR